MSGARESVPEEELGKQVSFTSLPMVERGRVCPGTYKPRRICIYRFCPKNILEASRPNYKTKSKAS